MEESLCQSSTEPFSLYESTITQPVWYTRLFKIRRPPIAVPFFSLSSDEPGGVRMYAGQNR